MSPLSIKATSSWLVLITLTLLSLAATELVKNPAILIAFVVLTIIVKGQAIVDVFMELRTAPAAWRWLLLSYVIVVPAIIGAIMVLL